VNRPLCDNEIAQWMDRYGSVGWVSGSSSAKPVLVIRYFTAMTTVIIIHVAGFLLFNRRIRRTQPKRTI